MFVLFFDKNSIYYLVKTRKLGENSMDMIINKNKTTCLTGHRPKSLPWGYDENRESCLRFKEEVRKVFVGSIEFGITTF